MITKLTPFHLAIAVKSLESSREFYSGLLSCDEGRSTDIWIDYNFFGHQLVCHKTEDANNTVQKNPVDEKQVPVPHFGVVLEMPDWYELKDKLIANKIDFVIEPYIRFVGEAGEQATMFLYDPSGNALEFKAFKDIDSELFRK